MNNQDQKKVVPVNSMEDYAVVYVEKPEEAAWGIIGRGIASFNLEKAGEENFQRICFVLQSPGGQVQGGVIGELYWGWFHLDLLWVEEGLRGRGFGGRLIEAVEDEAQRRGARSVFLDTFSFQAPDFYKKHGYQVFGELPDFPQGHLRYFMRKDF